MRERERENTNVNNHFLINPGVFFESAEYFILIYMYIYIYIGSCISFLYLYNISKSTAHDINVM